MSEHTLGQVVRGSRQGVRPEMCRRGHFGLVVADCPETVRRAREVGARILRDPRRRLSLGESLADRRFPRHPVHESVALEGIGFSGLEKSEKALAELRAARLAD